MRARRSGSRFGAVKASIYSLAGKEVGDLQLNPDIFGIPYRADILARIVRWQLSARRAGTHASKGVSDISGTTKKPWRQKGTGRARHGSLRSPQFRGGAVIFGPQVRSHAHKLPKKIRALGLRVVLSEANRSGALKVYSSLQEVSGKSKDLRALGTSAKNKTLYISAGRASDAFLRAARNLPFLNILSHEGLNVYDVLRHDRVLVEKEAVQALEERLA